MGDSWLGVALQLRDLPTYIALLQSHELPTRIASALDARASGQCSSQEDDGQELRAIIDILVQMMENEGGFGPSVSSSHQRMLDYAQEWASETLLSLPSSLRLGLGDTDTQTHIPVVSAALDDMHHALCVLRPHSTHDRLAFAETELQDALRGRNGDTMDTKTTSTVLETCAARVHADSGFVDWVEQIVSAQQVELIGPQCMARLLRPRKHIEETIATRDPLFGTLSLCARVTLWASDLSFWQRQLDDWLVEAHEAPFRAIARIVRVDPESPQIACPSHLHVALVSWATRPLRSRWLRASRSRALLSVVSRLVRDPEEEGEDAYGRTLLATVPRVLLQKESCHWTPRQRAFVLQRVAQKVALLTPGPHHQRLEFVGLVERNEILQSVIDTLLLVASSSAEWADAAAILAWHEGIVYEAEDDWEKQTIRDAIEEIAKGLGDAPDWPRALAWLQQHRSSSFRSCTLTQLRLTWRWLARACVNGTASSLSDALESVEYALRRFALADDTRRFQIEMIAMFVDDLEWCVQQTMADAVSHSEETAKALEMVVAWLRKLVRLLPTDAAPAAAATPREKHLSFAQQLGERLQAFTPLQE